MLRRSRRFHQEVVKEFDRKQEEEEEQCVKYRGIHGGGVGPTPAQLMRPPERLTANFKGAHRFLKKAKYI